MRRFADVIAMGLTTLEDDEIVLTIYGPKGGMRACESISPDKAKILGRRLIALADEFIAWRDV